MKIKGIVFCFYVACAALFAARSGTGSGPALKPAGAGGAAPLYFIANDGQTDAAALFYAHTPSYTIWLTREGLIFDRIEKEKNGGTSRSVTGLAFKNVNKNFEVMASDPSAYRVSYFYGRDESEWKTDIPTSRVVLYKNLYNGIDLKVYSTAGQIEYDWIVSPGARPEQIQFAFSGKDKGRLNGEGSLAVETPAGRILHRKPRAHQMIADRRVDVEAAFCKTGDGAFGFTLEAFDRRHELVIDPLVLAYSTYLGGHNEDFALNLAVDPTGAIYICGETHSSDFPPVTQTLPRSDVFITKLSPDGKSLIYSAFFPSGYSHEIMGIAVDAKGFVYLAGATKSSKFPVKNAFQAKAGGGGVDGFILKLARSGKSLVYSSYIGGTKSEECAAVYADASGAAYLAGSTTSPDFPTKNAFQKPHGGIRRDAFLAKVAPAGTSLVYSTCLGTTGDEICQGLAVEADGSATIAGNTTSSVFPVKSAFQKSYAGNWDGFVTKFSPTGDSLVYSSYLGGPGYDGIYNMGMDAGGAVYLVGFTQGSFPLKNAFQKTRKGGSDAFVAKIEPNGKAIAYSSYLGGAGSDFASAVAVDGDGAAHVVGGTGSANFPVKSPYQAARRGSYDGFLTIVDPGGLKLLSSTYLGGSYRDSVLEIALDTSGAVYLCGMTNSLDFPTLGPYQKALAGDADAFVVKFSRGDD
jgi:hypothetical protein